MAVWTVVILGFMICRGAAGHAQEAEQAKPAVETKAGATTEKPVHAYRLDFSVKELEDGKTINTRQYSMNMQADDNNEIKIGTRVPVESGQGQYQYIDVGTSIWCRIGERSEGIPLLVKAEVSNFAIPDHESGHPVIRQLKIDASTLALLGKPMIVGSVDDPNSKRQFQLEVTVTKLK
jgi:3D (Asp-Asp-Asp) domain-containing protein